MKTNISVILVFGINILNAVAVAATFILIANSLGPAEFGDFTFAFTVASFPPLFMGLGSEQVLLMYGSRDARKLRILLGHALSIRIVLSLAFFALFIASGLIISYSGFYLLAVAIAGSLLNGFYTCVFSSIFRVYGKHWLAVIFTFMGSVLLLILVLVLKIDKQDSLKMMSLMFISYLFTFLASWFWLAKYVKIHLRYKGWRSNLKLGLQFSVSQGIDLLFQRIDIFLIQLFASSYSVGIYSAGNRIVSALILFPSAMHYVFLPDFHKAASDGPKLEEAFSRFRKLILQLSGLVIGGIFFVAPEITHILYDTTYESASLIMRILAVSYLFMFITYPYSMHAEAMNMVGERLKFRIVALLIVVVTGCFTVPLWKEAGAAVAMALGSVSFFLQLHFAKLKNIHISGHSARYMLKFLLVVFLSGCAAYYFIRYVDPGLVSLIFALTIYTIVYLFAGSAFGVVYLKRLPKLPGKINKH